MIAARRPPRSLAGPIGASAILHAAIILPLLLFHSSNTVSPPMYKVQLIAAPAGERAVGVVSSAPAAAVPTTAPPKVPPKVIPKETKTVKTNAKVAKVPKPVVQATPQIATKQQAVTKDAPKAGGGTTGGKGADVASIDLQGLDFPYPGYLQNIVRQIALNFSPKGNVGALHAEVFFMIHRDGKVTDVRFISRSGNLAFDIEAQGAIDAAWRGFGALPTGYPDDVLPIVFSFDPNKLR